MHNISKTRSLRKGKYMADYQKMYHVLFAATEDALTLLEENMGTCGELGVPMRVRLLLEEAQRACEEIYINS